MGVSVYSLSILIGPLTEAFDWARAEVSFAKTILTTGFVLTGPIMGYLADRYGVRRIGIISLITLSIAMFSMTQVGPSILSFYIGLFLLSLAGCGTTPLVWTRAVATWFKKDRGLALALTLTGTGLMGVISPQLLDAAIQRFDWRAAYVTMGTFAALTLIPVLLFFRENRGDADVSVTAAKAPTPAISVGLTVGEAIRLRQFWQLGLAFFLVGGAVSALLVHLVPLITDAGISRSIAVKIAGILGVAIIFGRLATGYLVDRFHPPYIAAAFLIMPVLGCVLLINGPASMTVVILAVVCIGLAAGSEVDLIPFFTARYFGLKAYGKLYGWMFVAFYGGVGFGPPFLGHMYDLHGGYSQGLVYIIPVLALGALAVMTLGRSPQAN